MPPLQDYSGLYKSNTLLVADNLLAPIPPDVKADYIQMDYWHLFDQDELDPKLVEFIESGSKPIFFSFGSRTDSSGEQTVRMVEEIVKELDLRAVIQKGWAGYSTVDNDRIKVIGAAPHHKLFPLMAAAVHHGGAGTTHTAALAGIPQVIIPENGDQFFYGGSINRLKLGPAPIPKAKLNADKLKGAVWEAIHNREITESVKAAAETLGKRDIVEASAAKLMEALLRKSKS